MKPAGALALESNPSTGKPPLPTRLEQDREPTHAVCPSLTPGSSNTDTRWHWLLFQTREHPPTQDSAHNPCSSPGSCWCHEVPTLSKWFSSMFPIQCKHLNSSGMKRGGTSSLGMLPTQWKICHLTNQVRSVSERYYLKTIQCMFGGTSTLSYKTNFHVINLYLPFR